MKRRAFLTSLITAAAAAPLLPYLPKALPVEPASLRVRKLASFICYSEDIAEDSIVFMDSGFLVPSEFATDLIELRATYGIIRKV